MTERKKIENVLQNFLEGGLIKKDAAQVISCLSEQIIGIGIGEQGFVRSFDDIRAVLDSGVKEDVGDTHKLEYNEVEILILKEIFAVVCADITVLSQEQGEKKVIYRSRLTQSLSMVKEDDDWKICGLHASTPVVTEETMAAYPLKFAEKTLQSLREKIGEETYAVEEQYRQAILADTIAFYIIDFTLDVFEKCQLNNEWCAYTEPNTPYEEFIKEKSPEYLAEEDKALFLKSFSKAAVKKTFESGKNEISCEYRMKLPDGSKIWVRSIIRLITDSITGHKKGIMYVKNIDDSKREELMMLSRAAYDEMTGVYNKGSMTRCIAEALRESGGVFVMIDLDDLKLLNDTFGHPVGDRALIATTKELKDAFSFPALIGRMGGDEFSIFIPKTTLNEGTKKRLHRLLDRINAAKIDQYPFIRLTCSIGAVECTKEVGFEEAYNAADKALYLSKKNGKNCISFLDLVRE